MGRQNNVSNQCIRILLLVCHGPYRLYPPYVRDNILTKWNEGSQTLHVCYATQQRHLCAAPRFWACFPIWLKLVHGVRFTTTREFQLAPSSPLLSLLLWRRDIANYKEIKEANSPLESPTDMSYILNNCCCIPPNSPFWGIFHKRKKGGL